MTRSFASAGELEAWLEEHHATAGELVVQYPKKGTGIATVSLPEALDLMLCFGWIDGIRRGLDDTWYLQRYTPRRARSKWSKINVAKAEKLIAEGRMRPAGVAEVERAKADGRWDAAYDGQAAMQVPDDLRAALDADPEAKAFFDSLSATNRYAILFRLHDAKRPETRARRLETFMAMLRRRETLHA